MTVWRHINSITIIYYSEKLGALGATKYRIFRIGHSLPAHRRRPCTSTTLAPCRLSASGAIDRIQVMTSNQLI